MFDLRDVIGRDVSPIRIVDVGAMALENHAEIYAPLLRAGLATVIGFEPVPEEFEKLRASADAQHTYLPYAIGDGAERTFHTCNYAMTSSLYEPNLPLVEKFQSLAETMRVVKREQIQTHRLDDLPEVRGGDYLKLDVQGAELDVIRGAARLLGEVVLVHTEVEYVPLYKDQPLFADVDRALRQSGFLFHRVMGVGSRLIKPLAVASDLNSPGSQHLWTDAVYVRDFTRLIDLAPEKLLKLAMILHSVYQSLDLVNLVLEAHDQKTKTTFSPAYLDKLMSPATW